MTPGEAVLFAVVLLALLAGWGLVRWLVRRFKATQATFDVVVAPEPEHLTYSPRLSIVPDGLTCLRCGENPAMPERVWCVVCAPLADEFPAESIDRGGLDGCISRHPAGKQRKTGGDR